MEESLAENQKHPQGAKSVCSVKYSSLKNASLHKIKYNSLATNFTNSCKYLDKLSER